MAVAERYRGRIGHYQIWNEPNIFPEWGNNFVDPQRYVELLCRTYQALKQVDPEIVVISGALAPTISLDGYFGFSDVIFLQEMYDLGAGDCFDVLSAQGYGLFSGPSDRRLRATSVNVARHSYYRDIMVRNGDAPQAHLAERSRLERHAGRRVCRANGSTASVASAIRRRSKPRAICRCFSNAPKANGPGSAE